MSIGSAGAIVAGSAVVKMLPDFSGFGQKLQGGLDGFSRRASAIGGGLTKAVTLPILGIGVAAVKSFGDAQAVAAQTNAVLKSTGGAARLTAGDVGELATTLSKVTAFEDEVIQSGENLLLTFTNIRNEAGAGNDIFNQTTRTMLDMSQALGQDTKSSAIQLGKALNDPVKGVTALQRVGVSFTKSQKEQIKTLVAGGDTLGAQKLILAELSKEFGGSAEAFAKTGAGKMKQAMNELGNAGESLGAILLPIITAVSAALSKLAGWFANLTPGQQKLVAGFLGIAAAVGPLLLIAAKLSTAIGTLGPVFGSLARGAVMAFNAIRIGFTFLMANPLILGIAALAIAIFLIVKHWDKVKVALAAIWKGIVVAAKFLFGVLKTIFLNFTPVGLIIKHWNTIVGFLRGAWDRIVGGVRAVRDAIVGAFNAVKDGVRTAWDWIVSKIRGAIAAVTAPIRGFIGLLKKLPFVPGSPIPMVVGAEASVRAIRKLGAEARRVRLPALGAPRPGEVAATAVRGAVGATAGAGASSSKHYHLTTVTRQSLGSTRADFRLMEAMG